MKNHVLMLILLTFALSLHAMDLWLSDVSGSSLIESETDELLTQRSRSSNQGNTPNPRNVLINAILADREDDVVIGLFDFPELNTSGKYYGRDDPLLCVAAGHGRRTVLESLLANGAVPYVCDGNGDSPLHYAVRFGHLAVAEVLLKYGASLKARNMWGQTVLHQALEVTPVDYEIIKWLLENGADVNAQDDKKNSIAHCAYRHDREDVLDLLDTNSFIDWNMVNEDGLKPYQMQLRSFYLTPPAACPTPELEGKTIVYHSLDELLGYYFNVPRKIDRVINNKLISTYYYLLRITQDIPPQVITQQGQATAALANDDSFENSDELPFSYSQGTDDEKELSEECMTIGDQLLIPDDRQLSSPYVYQEEDSSEIEWWG